ncbi:MAG: glycerol dehydratase reactivase beta/small subunit family protein [Deltaproteobacteria bacterium]|nr:glycerol dehydratase reactivase beta/small subunit family protein [Deltaproteobacteria bacterium]MBW2069780.1 glycerol dehydratase reactivase beta/small subunit family protein [Deltaproteobacteria bacterium]
MKFSEPGKKPAVFIRVGGSAARELLAPIFWGLEEEGIPAELHETTAEPAVVLAKEAADSSPLNVGIGLNANEGVAVLHHRDLPADKPLFEFAAGELQPPRLRQLGLNAARLVKGDPLVTGSPSSSGLAAAEPQQWTPGELNQQQLLELIQGIVSELLQKNR